MHLFKFIKFDKGTIQPKCKQRASRCQTLRTERSLEVTKKMFNVLDFAFPLTSFSENFVKFGVQFFHFKIW